jgi:hypothetical protein
MYTNRMNLGNDGVCPQAGRDRLSPAVRASAPNTLARITDHFTVSLFHSFASPSQPIDLTYLALNPYPQVPEKSAFIGFIAKQKYFRRTRSALFCSRPFPMPFSSQVLDFTLFHAFHAKSSRRACLLCNSVPPRRTVSSHDCQLPAQSLHCSRCFAREQRRPCSVHANVDAERLDLPSRRFCFQMR